MCAVFVTPVILGILGGSEDADVIATAALTQRAIPVIITIITVGPAAAD